MCPPTMPVPESDGAEIGRQPAEKKRSKATGVSAFRKGEGAAVWPMLMEKSLREYTEVS